MSIAEAALKAGLTARLTTFPEFRGQKSLRLWRVPMPVKPLNPPGLPAPIAPYSMGMKAGHTIYASGVLAIDKDGKTVGVGDPRAQTKFVIETIEKILREGGATLRDVAFNTVILKDMADYAAVNEIYGQYFKENPPARYCIAAKLVRDDFLVEIASIAHIAAA